MPTPHIADIQPFIERLIRDPGAALVDETFARAFNRLPTASRRVIMERAEGVRRQVAATERLARAFGASEERVARAVAEVPLLRRGTSDNDVAPPSIEPAWEQSFEAEYREPPSRTMPYHVDEENARLGRIEQMRRDMAREIEEFRETTFGRYQRLPSNQQTLQAFQAWDRNVEQGVAGIRARWERRIADEAPRPTPPAAAWPDPAEYGPNGRYATHRGALNAFTRAVNNVYRTRVAGGAWEEERDRIHINGTLEIRRWWQGWQEMTPPTARLARTGRWEPGLPPPPTTQPWQDEPATSVDDETDVMIKHLPRDKRFMLVVPTEEALSQMGRRLVAAGIHSSIYHIHTVKMMGGASSNAVRILRYPIFIAPSVFKMHAARRGDWSEADLDALIELQGEIPDEETT